MSSVLGYLKRLLTGSNFLTGASLGSLILLFLVVLFWSHIVVTIPSGYVGVVWLRFLGGTVLNQHLGEGTRLILPWDKVFIYSVRLQRLDKSIKALSAEGMVVYIEVTINYTVAPETVGYLHTTVGPDYATRLIEPIIGSAMREMIADYPALSLTTLVQHNIEAGMGTSLQRKINQTIAAYGPNMQLIHIAGFSARKITLPLSVQQSIEASQVASERIRRFQFVLQQQKLEADRRVIEAEGIRRFQEIVTPTISDSFLRWRGIEATLELAKSPNSKIVVIGGGQNGLPLILDGRTDSAGSATGTTEPKSAPTGGGGQSSASPPPAVNGSGGLSSWGLPEVAAPDAMPSPGVGDNFALTPAH